MKYMLDSVSLGVFCEGGSNGSERLELFVVQ